MFKQSVCSSFVLIQMSWIIIWIKSKRRAIRAKQPHRIEKSFKSSWIYSNSRWSLLYCLNIDKLLLLLLASGLCEELGCLFELIFPSDAIWLLSPTIRLGLSKNTLSQDWLLVLCATVIQAMVCWWFYNNIYKINGLWNLLAYCLSNMFKVY